MEYTIRYEVTYDGTVTHVYVPTTNYSNQRPGGPVYHTEVDNLGPYRLPFTWKTEAGARKNIQRFEPSGDIQSATVIGIDVETLWRHGKLNVWEVDDLEASRKECAERLEAKRQYWEAEHAKYAAQSAKVKERQEELRQLLDETGIEGYDLEGYAHGRDPVGVWIPYEQAIKLLYMVSMP